MREHPDPARPAYFEYAHSNKRRNLSTYPETASGRPEPWVHGWTRICEYRNVCTQLRPGRSHQAGQRRKHDTVRLRHRPAQVRRLSCRRGGLQDEERRSPTPCRIQESRCASSETSPDAAGIGPPGAAGPREAPQHKAVPTETLRTSAWSATPRKLRRQNRSDPDRRPQRSCR